MAMSSGRTGRPWRRTRAIFKEKCRRENLPCHLCHGKEGPIDYDAKNDREQLAFQADHIIPWSKLPPGDRRRWGTENLAPSHALCNRRKQANLVLPEVAAKPVQRPAGW